MKLSFKFNCRYFLVSFDSLLKSEQFDMQPVICRLLFSRYELSNVKADVCLLHYQFGINEKRGKSSIRIRNNIEGVPLNKFNKILTA